MAGKPDVSEVMCTTPRVSGLLLATVLLVTACGTPSRADDVPALLVDPDEQARAELLFLVSSTLNDRPVTLAQDALTFSSVLTIERKPHHSMSGRPATGRMMESPEQFRLVQNESQCLLIHLGSGKRMPLHHAKCMSEQAP